MADLNSTIVRGNLRVTEEIIGPLNIANLSTGANGQFLSISNNVPTWVNNPNTNTWRPIKLDGTIKLNQWTSGSELNIKAGNNMTITESGGTFTFAATDTNTWRPLGTGANDAAAGNHDHDGRYIRWTGSAAGINAMDWGTLTTANGYTILSHNYSSDGGEWGMVNKSGQISMQLDGYYYQNEGKYRVLDTSGGSVTGELKLYAASGDSPRLTFQRGELTDSYNDWSIYDSAGTLYLQQRGGGSTAWETRGAIDQYGVNFIGTIAEDGTLLANKYAAKSHTHSDLVPKNHNSRFYPFIGSAYRKANYKVTLPISGRTSSSHEWMMITMELILGGSYSNGANGTIFLSYYFRKDTSNHWYADDVRAIGIGNKLADNSVRIQYDIANPGIFYVHSNNNEYNSFSIQNLTANDTAPNFDFTKTTIEPVDSIPSGLAVVPLTCLDSKGDNKLYVNNTAVSLDGHTHSSVTDIGNSTATTFAYSKSGLNYGDYTWLAGWNGYELRAVNKSQFATASHTHSNYVTTDTEQTISGGKTFSNTITANNWLYVPYIGTKTNKLYIEGPWDGAGQEQPTLTFEDGALKAYNWEYDGDSTYESMFDFRFPYGVQMSASGSSIYLNGNTNCYLQSTAKGWMVDGSDQYGCIYPAANHNGKIGLPANHFYHGYINYVYTTNVLPISYNGTSVGSNTGYVGTTNNYFTQGCFKTVYRTSESSLSDIRSKQNISNNDLNALEIINNLSIINFQYDDDVKAEAKNKKQRLKAINTMKELPKTKETKELRKELQKIIATPNNEDMITIGVSAQQLQELLPKKYQKTFIQKESTNQYADQLFIRENRLVYLSFKAIQEQQTIIDSLEEKINLLEEKINALEEKIKKEVN